jgi:hypothetical protein
VESWRFKGDERMISEILSKVRELFKHTPSETQETPLQQTFNTLGRRTLLIGGITFLGGLLLSSGLVSGLGGFLLGIGFTINTMLPMVK